MTDHLPECYQYEHSTQHMDSYWCDSDCEADCICPALRACDERVREDEFRRITRHDRHSGLACWTNYEAGRRAALDAAREAVAALEFWATNPEKISRPHALAAIDALLENN